MKRIKKWFTISIISFLLSSATILFMPFASFELEEKRTLAYILAAAFWLGIAAGLVFLRMAGRKIKININYKNIKSFAFLRFFNNKPALVFDALLIVSFLLLALALIVRSLPQALTIAGIFTFVFSLEMHGVFNGRIYKYLSE